MSPVSFIKKGSAMLKKPRTQVGLVKSSCNPCARETDTSACATCEAKAVCCGTKITACLTLALAEEMEVPTTIN